MELTLLGKSEYLDEVRHRFVGLAELAPDSDLRSLDRQFASLERSSSQSDSSTLIDSPYSSIPSAETGNRVSPLNR